MKQQWGAWTRFLSGVTDSIWRGWRRAGVRKKTMCLFLKKETAVCVSETTEILQQSARMWERELQGNTDFGLLGLRNSFCRTGPEGFLWVRLQQQWNKAWSYFLLDLYRAPGCRRRLYWLTERPFGSGGVQPGCVKHSQANIQKNCSSACDALGTDAKWSRRWRERQGIQCFNGEREAPQSTWRRMSPNAGDVSIRRNDRPWETTAFTPCLSRLRGPIKVTAHRLHLSYSAFKNRPPTTFQFTDVWGLQIGSPQLWAGDSLTVLDRRHKVFPTRRK